MFAVFYPCYPVCLYPVYPSVVLQKNDTIYRQYPEVDTKLFSKSAASFQKLMKEADLFVEKVSSSEDFARGVMDAAQQGDKTKVKSLISSTGIKEKVDVEYNPDQLRISLTSKVEQMDCCKLTLAFRWR